MGDRRFASRCRTVWAASKGYLALGFGITTLCLAVLVVLQAFELRQRYPLVSWGSVTEAFGAVGTVLAVAVALWQSVVIRRQAKADANDAAIRFQSEIEAANTRTVQEVEAAESRSKAELAAAAERHKVELDAQRELARVQRVNLQEQEFKLALIRVSRAASAYTHELATLVAETQRILTLPTRQERDDAIKPIAKKMNLVSHDLAIEVSGAHMLTNNDQLHAALDQITGAATDALVRANEYENTVIMAVETPNAAPIYMAMEAINRVVGDAIRLAGELLVTGSV
jgi:rRNA maturation endonuclease Nob1